MFCQKLGKVLPTFYAGHVGGAVSSRQAVTTTVGRPMQDRWTKSVRRLLVLLDVLPYIILQTETSHPHARLWIAPVAARGCWPRTAHG